MASRTKARVAVNGYGVIGKRVVDAVTRQDDMELIGISDVAADWRMRVAVNKGHTNQAIVIPETIDAIRALTGLEQQAQASWEKTNAALGIGGDFF